MFQYIKVIEFIAFILFFNGNRRISMTKDYEHKVLTDQSKNALTTQT